MADRPNFVFFNDRGLRAGWRFLIFLAILVCLFLVVSVPLRSMARQAENVLRPELQILGEGITFLVLLIACWIMSRIEKRPMGLYGLPLRNEPVFSRMAVGFVFWGFIPLSICLLALRLLHVFDFGNFALHGADIWSWGIKWLLAFLLVGFSEEYLLRGYALYTLADGIGFWPAAIVLGALFGLGHSRNPGETQIGIVATVVFALFASVTLRVTGNLWLAVGAHAGWDWGQSFFYGVSDSGITAQGHLLNPTLHEGPAWLTGGTVGPEGSIVTLILWSVMMLIFYFTYRRQPAPVIEFGAAAPPPRGLQ